MLHLNIHQGYTLILKGKKMWILRCKVINQSTYHIKDHGFFRSLVRLLTYGFFMCNYPSYIVFVLYVCLKLTKYFTCILTDNEGIQVRKQLTLNDVWFLSPNERILVKWNSDNQPINDSGTLLNRFLGCVTINVNAFPISYQSWRKIPKKITKKIYLRKPFK